MGTHPLSEVLFLPQPNEFLPSDLSLRCDAETKEIPITTSESPANVGPTAPSRPHQAGPRVAAATHEAAQHGEDGEGDEDEDDEDEDEDEDDEDEDEDEEDDKNEEDSCDSHPSACSPGARLSFEPECLLKSSQGELWHLMDSHFRTPRAVVRLLLQCPRLYASPKDAVCAGLFAQLLSDWLSRELYPAKLAELDYSLSALRHAIEIKVSGFSHKLPQLLLRVAAHVGSFASKTSQGYELHPAIAARFAIVKATQILKLQASNFEPGTQTANLRAQALRTPCWPQALRMPELTALKAEELAEFACALLAGPARGVMLAMGNLSKDETLRLWVQLTNMLPFSGLQPHQIYEERSAVLPAGVCVRVTRPCANPGEAAGAVEMHLQAGLLGLRGRCLLRLLQHVIWEPCFDVLRTQKQLGYDVGVTKVFDWFVFGLNFFVQSSSHSAQQVEAAVEAFIREFDHTLQNMDAETLEEHVTALAEDLAQPPRNLGDAAARVWGEISNEDYVFDRKLSSIIFY